MSAELSRRPFLGTDAPSVSPVAWWISWTAVAVATGLAVTLLMRSPPVESMGLLLLLVVVTLAIAVVAFVRPEPLVVVAFFLLPFVRGEPAPVDAIFLLLIVATLVSPWRRLQLPSSIAFLLTLYVAISALSIINAINLRRAFVFEFQTVYLILLGAWLTSIFGDAILTRRALKAYIITAAIAAALGVVALEIGFPGSSYLLYGGERPKVFFKDANVFGPFLVPAAVIVLEDLARPRLLSWPTAVKALLLATLTAGVIFSFSRGAWLNLTLAIATVLVWSVWRRGGLRAAFRALVALAVVAAAGLGLLVATGSFNFFEQRSSLQAYDQERFGAQHSAFEHITAHVFGSGPGQAEEAFNISTHSLYVRVAFEQGLPGALVLGLIVVATTLFTILVAIRRTEFQRVGTAAILGSWIGILVSSVAIDTVHWRHLWMVAALIWASYYALRADGFRSESNARPAVDTS